jgi:hypothetical protein
MDRYRVNHQDPPKVLYSDQDCCSRLLHNLFAGWVNLQVRLDAWDFMRLLNSCISTEMDTMYAQIAENECLIFEWHQEYLEALIEAKRNELQQQGSVANTDQEIMPFIKSSEFERHCRCKTRDPAMIEGLPDNMFIEYITKGKEPRGVPYESQKRHMRGLQDIPGLVEI